MACILTAVSSKQSEPGKASNQARSTHLKTPGATADYRHSPTRLRLLNCAKPSMHMLLSTLFANHLDGCSSNLNLRRSCTSPERLSLMARVSISCAADVSGACRAHIAHSYCSKGSCPSVLAGHLAVTVVALVSTRYCILCEIEAKSCRGS
jgi:hypothetical protein